MNKDEWDSLIQMADRELMDFTTETDSSQRKHAAMHILAMRRNKVMERVTLYAAIAAFCSVVVSVLQLLRQ